MIVYIIYIDAGSVFKNKTFWAFDCRKNVFTLAMTLSGTGISFQCIQCISLPDERL